MPVFEIETPQGSFEVEAPDEQTAIKALQQHMPEINAPQAAPQQPEEGGIDPRAFGLGSFGPGFFAPGGHFQAATEGSHAGVTGGFDDELSAAVNAPFSDKTYGELQAEGDQRKAARREQFPITSIAGEVAGGLGTGAIASRAGLTFAGRSIPGLSSVMPRTAAILPAAAEGAAYGALYGAGEAKPGERMSGAATGATIGGVTGGALQGIGNAVATRSARSAAQAAAPAADDIGQASQALYRASEAQGVRFKAQATDHLRNNLTLAAGERNLTLRPMTAGTMRDANRMLQGDLPLEKIDEFRQGIVLNLKAAKGQDVERLTRMKGMVDAFLDNAASDQMTGGAAGVPLLKEARSLWARQAKTQTIENILDMADVTGKGQYTQSGFANAVKNEMKTLYKAIKRGKEVGWTKEEVALIRQMAAGGSNSTIINLFAKFAPRGVVSALSGPAIGSMAAGPVGAAAVPLAGHLAGRAADRGAMAAAQALRTGVATGVAPNVLPQVTRRVTPAIPALVSPSMGTGQSLATSRAR